jgi:hypothetical protein
MSRQQAGISVTSLPMPVRYRRRFTRMVDGAAIWLLARGYPRPAVLLWKVTGLW